MKASLAVLDSFVQVTGPTLVDRLNAGVKWVSSPDSPMHSMSRSWSGWARRGSICVFARLADALDVPVEELAAALRLSARTLRRRKLLSADETERAFCGYRVLRRTREVFDDNEDARTWMVTTQSALGERTPLSLLIRDVGTEQVLNFLSAIENGGCL